MPEPKPPYFAVHCEIQDAAASATLKHALGSPAAATIEFAKILQRFETQIDDDWRAKMVDIGGSLSRLDKLIQTDDVAAELGRHDGTLE